MKSPRELLLSDMVVRIGEARAHLAALEREYKLARMIPGLPVVWQPPDGLSEAATVVKATDKSVQIDVGDSQRRRKWVPLDSVTIREDSPQGH